MDAQEIGLKQNKTQIELTAKAISDKRGRRTISRAKTKGSARSKYIMVGEDGQNYLIETAQGYCARKSLPANRSSNIKKLTRMQRVRDRGFTRRRATSVELYLFGPPINVEDS